MKLKNILQNFSLSKTVDFVVINISLFILIFVWLKFITRSLALAIGISIVILFIYNTLKIIRNKTKQQKKQLSKYNQNSIDNKVYSLIYLPENEINKLFLNIYLAINNGNNALKNIFIKDKDKKIGISYYFEKELLEKEFCLKIIYNAIKLHLDEIIICCYSCSEKDYQFFQNIHNIKVVIYQKDDVYKELFEGNNITFESQIDFSSHGKKKLKEYAINALGREKSKKYFLSGLLIFFVSIIVRYNLYYVMMSSLLFLLALISRKNKSKQL